MNPCYRNSVLHFKNCVHHVSQLVFSESCTLPGCSRSAEVSARSVLPLECRMNSVPKESSGTSTSSHLSICFLSFVAHALVHRNSHCTHICIFLYYSFVPYPGRTHVSVRSRLCIGDYPRLLRALFLQTSGVIAVVNLCV